MSLVTLVPLFIKLSLTLIVFAVGLKAAFSDAISLFRHPNELGRAFLSMNVLMPLLAVLILPWLPLYPAVKIALVALAVSPVPPFLPGKAIKEGGRQSYVLGLLVSSALLSIIVVPVTMKIIAAVLHVPIQMTARDVAILVFTTILVPLAAGMVVRAFVPSVAGKIAGAVNIVALLLLVVGFVPVLFGSARMILSLVGHATIVVLAGFAALGLIIGHLLGGPQPENRRTLALATSSRHPGMAVAIAHMNFPSQKQVIPAILLYLILAMIVSAVLRKKTGATKTVEAENPKVA